MFAIVKISGKQYKVDQGSVLDVDRIEGNVGDTVTFSDVLLRGSDTGVDVGTPTVTGAKVTATIEKQGRGEKIDVARYKHKVRYRRHIGFRAELTTLKITTVA